MNFFGFSSKENTIQTKNDIRLYVHDDLHIVKANEYTPNTTLNTYLRKNSFLTGTKVMCREGGCGCCVVVAYVKHPVTLKEEMLTVNSCLVSVFSCDGWRIVTVEGLKSPKDGYHKVQNALVKYSGTQCGFCSSGMIMNMYYLSNKANLTKEEIDNSFGGNLCRCTGYRPILEACKSVLNSEASPDIEDVPVCPLKDELKSFTQLLPDNETPFGLSLEDSEWYKVFTISEIFQLFNKYPKKSYRLVAGNTARGVYKKDIDRELYIDIGNVKELKTHSATLTTLTLGANMTLNETMELFRSTKGNFKYLNLLADHIDLIATIPVRNIGTLAGNLSIKHQHNEFPSDIFLLLETVGAKLTIASSATSTTSVTLVDFLKTDMNKKLITKITLPALNSTYIFNSYKIMPRAQNAHAMVNAGFLLEMKSSSVKSVRVVYGGINPKFIHATKLEGFLVGKPIWNNETLQNGCKTLDEELQPDHVLPDPSPEFRKGLAIALFYKFMLSTSPESMLSPKNVSGARKLKRPVSSGTQDLYTNEKMYPVSKPIPKLEALAQVSGEAKYVMDYPDQPYQLFVALAQAKAPAFSTVTDISTKAALDLKGVVAVYTAKDVPGKNIFSGFLRNPEPLFADTTVIYYDQPIAAVLATSQEIAEKGAELVTATYGKSPKKPVLSIQQILKNKDADRIKADIKHDRTQSGPDKKHTFKGTFYASLQYHFHLENQSCNVIPIEENAFNVLPTTQWMDVVQSGMSIACKVPMNKFNIWVRRLGGAYGAKITRNAMASTHTALCSTLSGRPARIWLPLETNMTALGFRVPAYAEYTVTTNDKGVIQTLDVDAYMDLSTCGNEPQMTRLLPMILNGYKSECFQVNTFNTFSDTVGNVSCRGPGTTEGFGLIESVMDHISYELNLDPLEVRKSNWDQEKHGRLLEFLKEFLKPDHSDYENRKADIEQFNQDNRWRKKGLSIVTMAYPYEIFGNWNVIVSIYHVDGTVGVAHGGIEMGQGINTKVAQVCAYKLGIPLEKVDVKPSNNLLSPNVETSGGSATSESVCWAVIDACDILIKRMAPIKEKMQDPTWEQLINECHNEGVPLYATASFNNETLKPYTIYGICAAEVEVDILTGNHIISRVDLLEDVGQSLSPLVDLGQVEGAFVMGIGYWTSEEIIFSEEGEVKTNRTWTYKVPGAKDIPVDFRVKFPVNENPQGLFNSKATGEPAVSMSFAVPLALQKAISSARKDANPEAEKWVTIDGPITVEKTFLHSLNDYKQYVF